jgi:uncharacterized membrane protein YcaP (DUF421 family)
MFFDSWDELLSIVISCILVYPGLVLLLRLYGKRTLSKMNMFDFIITIALGSTFASTVLLPDVTIAEGFVAYVLLLSAQFSVTWLSSKSQKFADLVKADPVLVYFQGEFLHESMNRVRVTEEEIYATIREFGYATMGNVYAVILENNGVLSVVGEPDAVGSSTMNGVKNYDRQPDQKIHPESIGT